VTLIDDVCYAEYAKCLQTGTGTRGTTGTTRSETWGFANSVIRQDSEFQCVLFLAATEKQGIIDWWLETGAIGIFKKELSNIDFQQQK